MSELLAEVRRGLIEMTDMPEAFDAFLKVERHVNDLEEQLEAAREELAEADAQALRYEGAITLLEEERDLIGTALGDPCAECGHIEWRSDGYPDMIRSRLVAADEAVETLRAALQEITDFGDRTAVMIANRALASNLASIPELAGDTAPEQRTAGEGDAQQTPRTLPPPSPVSNQERGLE
jgi:chromosome segregation ATPase